jgi:hypothetical protein
MGHDSNLGFCKNLNISPVRPYFASYSHWILIKYFNLPL